jgi:arylsulfatase
MKDITHITFGLFAAMALALVSTGAFAADPSTSLGASKPKIIHDAEYYILDAQYGENWKVEDKDRGGKGDYLEGGVRVPGMAWWPGVILPGQTVGDIIHETDLFTTFAHLGDGLDYIPTDRIIDGIDQTALFLNGDTHGRRDYVYIYTGPVLAATVKGRYKRVWQGEKAGLPGASFFDLYTDPREVNGKFVPMFPAKSMFNLMKTREELWMAKYPNTPDQRGWPLTGIENARPETKAASKPRVNVKDPPFNPMDTIKDLPGWEGSEFDQSE